MSRAVSGAVALLLVAGCAGVGRLRLQELPGTFRRFVQPDGREVQLRGFNAIVKGFPWLPARQYDPRVSLAREDLLEFRRLGLNLVRLGVMWPGVEPAPGQYNETYLDAIVALVQDASAAGLWTLLDMHQDMGSPKTCGEGIVDWAANFTGWSPFPVPVRLAPYPTDARGHVLQAACDQLQPWYLGQAAVATQQTFQNLFSPSGGLPMWAAAWRKIAERTKDLPGVIGYELINEPGVGNIAANPKLAMSEYAEKVNLQPAYDVVASAIRTVAPESIIFFQPILISTGCGFTHAPGGHQFANRSVLAFHHYSYPSASQIVTNKVGDARRLGTGLLASEFQAPDMHDPEGDSTWQQMSKACDHGAVGFGLWEYKPYCDNRTGYGKCITGYGQQNYTGTSQHPNLPVRRALSRPFLPVIGGWLRRLDFNVKTGAMTAELSLTSGETQVFIGPDWLMGKPGPRLVRVTPRGAVLWKQRADGLAITRNSSTPAIANVTLYVEL